MSRRATLPRALSSSTPEPIKTAMPAVTPSIASTSAWSLSSPSTWPKWLIALVIGVPLTVGGAYWYYSQQKKRPVGMKRSIPSGGSKAQHGRHLGAGDSAGSTPVFSPMKFQEPKTLVEKIAYLKNEGNKLFRDKRYMDAKKSYTEAIELAMQSNYKDLDLAQNLQNRAACNEQLKHFEEVVADCSAAIGIDKGYAKAYARRSRALERAGKLHEAVYDLVAASILTSFQNDDYRQRSEKLLNDLAKKISHDVMKERKAGNHRPKLSRTFVHQFNHGFTQDPLKAELEKIDQSQDETDLSRIQLALVSLDKGNYDRVIGLCTETLDTCPADQRTIPRLLRGTMHFLYGNTTEAKTDLIYVAQSDHATLKEKSNARIKLACLLLQDQVMPDEVLSRLNDAAELDPSNPDIFFHKAQCYMLFNQFEECLKDFCKCRELQGNNNSTCTFHIAHIEFRIRMSQNPSDMRPFATLEEQISTLGSSEAFVLLGQLYLEMKDFEKAEIFYKRALLPNDDSHNAVVFTQQAMLEMMWHENKDVAQTLLAKALLADPNYSPAVELIMDLELQAGNMEAAKEHYQRCLDLAKSEAELVSVVQAYQIGEAGHAVYANLGIEDQSPLRNP
ncbi:Mitochondrial import receptor subunit TOM70 [Hypsibius exemplaris]|uniref:Mitochondrial import receptor subunit TOM70 n=1 Tax=Hypsibius exemplaris TaxID=2072580 RepID=A0A9X6RLD8_HYPEX|nr:Mitochondrial import receptor subunit TOM70 [Hypsibius exemplaris]